MHVVASWETTYLILFSFPFHFISFLFFFFKSDLNVLQLKFKKFSTEHRPALAPWREGPDSALGLCPPAHVNIPWDLYHRVIGSQNGLG